MFIRICLLALFTIGIALADDRYEYDRLKLEIQEQKRALNRHHSMKEYREAIVIQDKIAKLAGKALKLGLASPEIKDRGVWSYHADIMKDVGRNTDALEAVDAYMKTPLLNRNGRRHGWRKRYEIHKRSQDFKRAERALGRSLSFTDRVSDRFNSHRDLANLKLKSGSADSALDQANKMKALLGEFDEERRPSAQKTYQATLVKIYEEMGNASGARDARWNELKLKVLLTRRELDNFEQAFPKEDK